jgi:DNA replication and repair protein RecF
VGAYHSLTLINFRSYREYSVEFAAGVNIIVGPNGSGKTNLLEALYVLSHGSSFRATDRDMIKHDESWFRLEGAYDDLQRVMTCQVGSSGQIEKQFTVDGVKKARLTHNQRLPVVLFEPDHLRLLRESPSHRREYLDTLLSKLQPDFTWLKHQFERVLLQRNNILKRRLPPVARDDQLFVWDIKFAELSEQIVTRRRELVALFAGQMSEMYSTIAHRTHTVVLTYDSTVPTTDYRAGLLKLLQQNAQKDSERGFTTVGPQRDDLLVQLDGAPASAAASRGEVRSLLLALKMIELHLLHERYGTPPLLLLDDVFSELDAARRQALAKLAKEYQTLITTTDADAIVEHFLQDYRIIATDQPDRT